MTFSQPPTYGEADGTLQAIGGLSGLQTLVETFYRIMENTPEFRPLFDMHPNDIEVTIDKLVCFLSGWMGGERLFSKKYGPISLPQAHAHLVVTEKEKAMWLDCMAAALDELDYSEDLKAYLLPQLAFPAERIRQVSAARQH
ncbi:group II truncated hemoglobin [Marinomonas sp. IMCC 4694]|uniref:group II truncated hemoglobin n=1 Tax=Marinomonas sp. IMCC 4694 TaxID=2605432 RepID=UPI0011E6D82A|nr:group II truncated hemoglobin [Marinomonas sp. IMCC 4694]TYL46518.1 group II truncated hemoglobin [Marinomonas sp. IMCC 4694]